MPGSPGARAVEPRPARRPRGADPHRIREASHRSRDDGTIDGVREAPVRRLSAHIGLRGIAGHAGDSDGAAVPVGVARARGDARRPGRRALPLQRSRERLLRGAGRRRSPPIARGRGRRGPQSPVGNVGWDVRELDQARPPRRSLSRRAGQRLLRPDPRHRIRRAGGRSRRRQSPGSAPRTRPSRTPGSSRAREPLRCARLRG